MDGGRNYGRCYCGETMSAHINVSKPLPRHKFIAVDDRPVPRGTWGCPVCETRMNYSMTQCYYCGHDLQEGPAITVATP